MSATLEHAIATSTPRERSGRAFRVVRVVLGLLLLTAAGLKLYGMNVTALPRAGWFATPRVQIMAAEWELVLGLWLLSGVFQFGAWLAAIGTFATFAGVSAYFGWIGVANCGCFGVIHTSPWVAFAVDVAALVGLGPSRPHRRPKTRKVTSALRSFVFSISACVFVFVVATTIIAGSPSAALAIMRGERLVISDSYVDFGSGRSGEILVSTVEIHNLDSRPVRLLGGTSDCSCVITDNLPAMLLPGQSQSITIHLTVPSVKNGALTRVAEIWTDQPGSQRIQIHIGCRIVS